MDKPERESTTVDKLQIAIRLLAGISGTASMNREESQRIVDSLRAIAGCQEAIALLTKETTTDN